EAAGLAYARESTNWSEAGKKIEHAARQLRLAAAPIEKMPGRKATFQAIPNAAEFDAALDELLAVLDKSSQLLGVVSEKHPDLAAAAKTCLELRARLFQWSQPDRQGESVLASAAESSEDGTVDAAAVRWVELGLHHLRIHSAPLSVAQVFSRYRSKDQTWVL